MDSLVNQMSNAILINIYEYPHTETHIKGYPSKTWILKGDASDDFQKLNYFLDKWSIKSIDDRYYQNVSNISTFFESNKQKFENYQKHSQTFDDLLKNLKNELKCKYTFNNASFCGWNYFENLTIRLNKYNLEKNVIIFEGKESVMNAEKLLKFVIKNKKKIALVTASTSKASGVVPHVVPTSKTSGVVPYVAYTADERHLRMLRANSTPYKNHRNCMFLKRPLEKRFKVQACKPLQDKSQDPEYLAFVLENFKM
jgi:hypothetical protein